ncbi:type I DNA topoisomerase [Oscillibacter valericigenes]|uniref:type I DNA topoisomerase n=1 Tax=Oscillibacter valericigenes TaxID=351091 RepID=UPI001F03041D|nr:type I DNA topoisomerase [Oscillibacter valericigenes]MCF2617504.1 type I DNA topoisomerase [Oscillibacter valericigenes]
MANHSLVIVESPAKAKTIGKYLGKDFTVKACMGHLRDLPKSTLGVDVEKDFEPIYKPIKGKEDIISDLKKSAKAADTVYLATDPDREGEAISWHLKQLLNLPDEKTKRVTFNEITKKVVQESIREPRDIDQNLVDAQQARRILDRLVGYELSPLLWKKIRRGLSAGRVQSVATRMVDDREREIEAFQPEEYWSLDANLLGSDVKKIPFAAHYHGKNGKKAELKSEAEVDAVIRETENGVFTVRSVKRTDKQRSPSPPFTTSTLQQEASRKLSMTPRRTMAIAQQLYEGVDIEGEGTVGLITYMRTDSLRISEEAIASAKEFILGRYGAAYYPPQAHRYKAKAGAQDAHEAIRPSNVNWTPEDLRKNLTGEQYRLYRLIWSRFVACQMSNAVYDSVAVEIEASGHSFRASSSSLKFSGYTAVYEEGKDDEKEEKESPLPALQEGETLALKDFTKDQHFTQPPAHYTDATLIRAMEEQGIGRPSTYAPTVSTIIDREYVIKEGKYLRITNLGRVVTELMKDKFSDIADTKFTAHMEKELDSVEEGTTPWKGVLRDFYGDFEEHLKKAEQDLEGVRIKVPDEVSEEVCPECGRNLVVKSGRFGRFLACPGYPDCSFTMPLVVEMPGRCPKCGGRLMKRTGTSKKTNKQYTYYCCEHLNSRDESQKCDFMTWDVPVKDDCPVCGHTMFKKAGKGFKKPFCINEACSNFLPEEKRGYPKPAAKAEGESPAEETEEKKPAAKKTAAKKTAAKKPAAKKTAAKKTAAKKTAEKA